MKKAKQKDNRQRLVDYDRAMLRSAILSVFWAAISHRKSNEKYTFQELADRLGVNKSVISKWFSDDPNWKTNTMADIAGALNLDIQMFARDTRNGNLFCSSGQIGREVTVDQVAEQVNKAIAQIEAGDYDVVDQFDDD